LALCELLEQLEVAADQRFLLRTAPALHLPLRRDRIRDALKFLVVDQLYRPPLRRVATEVARVVLTDTALKRAPRVPV